MDVQLTPVCSVLMNGIVFLCMLLMNLVDWLSPRLSNNKDSGRGADGINLDNPYATHQTYVLSVSWNSPVAILNRTNTCWFSISRSCIVHTYPRLQRSLSCLLIVVNKMTWWSHCTSFHSPWLLSRSICYIPQSYYFMRLYCIYCIVLSYVFVSAFCK